MKTMFDRFQTIDDFRLCVTLEVDRRATASILAADPIDHPGQFMSCPLNDEFLPDALLII